MPEQTTDFLHEGLTRANDSRPDNLFAAAFDWTHKNVLNPVANAALIESYNAVAGTFNGVIGRSDNPLVKEAKHLQVDEAKFMDAQWFTQNLAGGIGMLVPYVIAGKVMGGAMRATGERFELQGAAATFAKSERAAQIIGAGVYDAMRTPRDGETRLGNSLAGMAGFGVFEYGNALSLTLNPVNKVIARIGVGAFGASTSQTVSHLVSQGELPSLQQYTEGGVSGAAMNIFLPMAQRGIVRISDHISNAAGRGIPLDRYVDARPPVQEAIGKSPMMASLTDGWVRVKEGAAADGEVPAKNRIEIAQMEQSPEQLAAMLKRLNAARTNQYEAEYKAAEAHLRAGDMDKAWDAFRKTRLNQEVDQFDARLIEHRVARELEKLDGKGASPGLKGAIDELVIKSKEPSEDGWRREFEEFKATGGKYRPEVEFRSATKDSAERSPEAAKEAEAIEMRALATHLVKALQTKGFTAVFAGGAVRDEIRGYIPKDYDIATSATPDQVEAVFKNSGATVFEKGKSFGVVAVAIDGKVFEIATLRTEGKYTDNRRPDKVEFVTSLFDDAARRDLTVNAMFKDPVSGQLHDYFGGQEDLSKGILRAVGDPVDRITEDPLRMMRVARFAGKLGFEADPSLVSAIKDNVSMISLASKERWRDEIDGLLTSKHPIKGLEVMRQTGLMQEMLPEVETMFGPKGAQDPYWHSEGSAGVHSFEVVSHLSKTRGNDFVVMLAGLLHDNAKPDTQVISPEGRISNHGHDVVGAEKAQVIAKRLKMSNADTDRLVALVKDHMRMHTVTEMRPATLAKLMEQPYFEDKMALQHADARATHSLDGIDHSHLDFLSQALEKLKSAADPALQLNARPIIDGNILKAMDFRQGPVYKLILGAARDAQREGQITSPEDGRAWILENFQQYRGMTMQQQTELGLGKDQAAE